MMTLNLVTGFGAFHGGIEVNGVEYSFSSKHGIVHHEPMEPMHLGLPFRRSIDLGTTELCPQQIEQRLSRMSDEIRWAPGKHNVLQNNCLHFCSAFAQELDVG